MILLYSLINIFHLYLYKSCIFIRNVLILIRHCYFINKKVKNSGGNMNENEVVKVLFSKDTKDIVYSYL